MVNDEPNPGRWPLRIWSRPNVVNKTGKLLSTIFKLLKLYYINNKR